MSLAESGDRIVAIEITTRRTRGEGEGGRRKEDRLASDASDFSSGTSSVRGGLTKHFMIPCFPYEFAISLY